jgi:hypothetical protein
MLTANDPWLQIKRRLRRVYRKGVKPALDSLRGRKTSALHQAIAASPLMIAEKTYNTDHKDYEPELVSNFAGRIYNASLPSNNRLFVEIKKLARGKTVRNRAWDRVLKLAAEEASTVAGFAEVMERIGYIENYLAELGRRHQAHYVAGWVNLVDAHFLYWAVRRSKPDVIVQTGGQQRPI